ncbi:MAG: hypothetical protein MJ025_07035 [Victivallaceae bacterium]|nr:hypothetical protein [Victivallaceae bacterium]
MAEELQNLLDHIYNNGVEKATAESERILAEARKQAAQIVSDAKRQADELLQQAKSEAAADAERSSNAVKQAARDVVLKLREELLARMNNVVSGSASAALTPKFMAQLISELASNGDAEVICAAREKEAVEKALASFRDSFRSNPKVLAGGGVTGGMQVSVGKDGTFVDFSLEAVTELVGGIAGKRVAELFKD